MTYLHRDQVGSVVMTTQDGEIADSRMYYAYGSKRGGDEYPFELNYTGQRKDDTGLLYYKARYYDPEIGLFISPDSMIPDPGDPFSYNRFLYGRGNPISNNDPSGHCPAPPEGMGATICMSLFIEPESVPAGPFTVHGDGRGFESNSDPAASRGYIWIGTESGEVVSHMNPSVYLDVPVVKFGAPGCGAVMCLPTLVPSIQREDVTFAASAKNRWVVSGPNERGEIVVNYELVISGPLDASGTAPYINGTITFFPQENGRYGANWSRDGFPWAEAYFHNGNGDISKIFQDPAVRGNPYDLFGIEPGINPLQLMVRQSQRGDFGAPQMSIGQSNR